MAPLVYLILLFFWTQTKSESCAGHATHPAAAIVVVAVVVVVAAEVVVLVVFL